MDFRLLGPVEAGVDGQLLDLGPRQQRFILAALLLEANRVVPTARLIELLWPGEPPRSARHAIQVRISRLRAALGASVPLVGDGDGYRIQVDPGRVDVHRFRDLLTSARAAVDQDLDERAVELFAQALALWTGQPLSGAAPAPVRDQLCHGLEEARMVAVEDRIDAELRLGRHAAVVDELAGLVRVHPARERLVGQLMLAWHRCGQTARALEVARATRTHLVEELGIDPGSELQNLELALLRDDPGLAAPDRPRGGPDSVPSSPEATASAVPAQLPPAVSGFTGRGAQLEQLDQLMSASVPAEAPEPPRPTGPARLVVLSGMGGVGKTSLAVRWAHSVAERFPDGQLYLDLRGYAPRPALRPVEALAHFLRGLGVEPDAIPTDVHSATAAYRTALAGRRVLVVLDNAASADQVRPLLPGAASCLTLVTSRDRLAGLVAKDGAQRLPLDTLDGYEAIELLEGLLGPGRAAAEADVVADLAELTARHPLALRIAAGFLTDNPQHTVASYVEELRGGNLLDSLSIDGDDAAALRATFDLSYRRLDPNDRRMFRLLGLVPGSEFTAPAAAALADVPTVEARRRLHRLTATHLLTERAPGRYAFHDLLRQYAGLRAKADESGDTRAQAIEQLMAWYFVNTRAAVARLFTTAAQLAPPSLPAGLPEVPSFGREEALRWFADEVPSLLDAITHAADHGPRRWAWLLAESVRHDLHARGLHLECLLSAEAAVRAATRAGADASVGASVHMGYANALSLVDDQSALPEYATALRYAEEAGESARAGAILNNIGLTQLRAGNFHEAAALLLRSLEAKRAARHGGNEANSLANLGIVSGCVGELRQGLAYLHEALEIHDRNGDRSAACFVLVQLAAFNRSLGDPHESLRQLVRAVGLAREFGNGRMLVDAPIERAETLLELGRIVEARAVNEKSLVDADELGVPLFIGGARLVAGALCLRAGDGEQALVEYDRALQAARRGPNLMVQMRALRGLAEASALSGRLGAAADHAQESLSLAGASGAVAARGHGLTVLADIARERGRATDAVRHADEAVTIHRRTGHHLGKARALVALAAAVHADHPAGTGDRARACLREAYELFSSFGAPEAHDVSALLTASVPAGGGGTGSSGPRQ